MFHMERCSRNTPIIIIIIIIIIMSSMYVKYKYMPFPFLLDETYTQEGRALTMYSTVFAFLMEILF